MKRRLAALVLLASSTLTLAQPTPPPASTPAAATWENPLKKLLRAGKPVIGMTVTIPNADVVLQAARLGFDFVWIEMEHSPITLEAAGKTAPDLNNRPLY